MTEMIHPSLVLVPDPKLRRPSLAVVDETPDQIKELVHLMKEVLVACRAAGITTGSISAPQVGVMKRLFIISSPAVELVAINPVITKIAGEQTLLEGCLSFPVGTKYALKRPKIVKFRYVDVDGTLRTGKFHDLYAAIVCHEIDHLAGKLIDDEGMPVFR
jgi:peptide deformylase